MPVNDSAAARVDRGRRDQRTVRRRCQPLDAAGRLEADERAADDEPQPHEAVDDQAPGKATAPHRYRQSSPKNGSSPYSSSQRRRI